jgi:Glycine-zipper domain
MKSMTAASPGTRRTVRRLSPALLLALPLGACAVAPPSGPTVVALPGQGKSLAQFQSDDLACRDYAQYRTGGTAQASAEAGNAAAGSAVVGTALGAAAGALIGAASGNAGAGAAIGAGAGLIGGSAVGAGNAQAVGDSAQQRYDVAYAQCMASKGDTINNDVLPAPPPVYAYPYPAYGWGPGFYYGRPYW